MQQLWTIYASDFSAQDRTAFLHHYNLTQLREMHRIPISYFDATLGVGKSVKVRY
jgi:hypothetical protein